MTLLEALGSRSFPPATRKKIRDDVLWFPGATVPWRRSPRWLVLRLGLLRHLTVSAGEEVGRIQYKFLMCITLLQLQEDAVHQKLPLDVVATLKTKLARRLAKLEEGRRHSRAQNRSLYDGFFRYFVQHCEKALMAATNYINSGCETFKRQITKIIPALPNRALPADLRLTLRNSSPYLRRVMSRRFSASGYTSKPALPNGVVVDQQLHSFANPYFELSKMEAELEAIVESTYHSPHAACALLSERLHKYLDYILAIHYDQDSEQSSFKILTVMEVWTLLDKICCSAFPLLEEYHRFSPPSLWMCLFSQLTRIWNA